MRRLFHAATLMLLLAVVLTPLFEYFDRWDAPGVGNDTEMAVFCLVLLLCLILVVCKMIASRSDDFELVGLLVPLPDRVLPFHALRGFPLKRVIPPILIPLRI